MTTDLRTAIEALPSPDPTFPSGYYTADMVSRAAVLALLDAAPAPGLDVERLYDAMPTTEAEWRPFWHRVDDPDAWVVSIYGHKLAEHIALRYAALAPSQPEPDL